MTIREICEAAHANGDALFYFGDNMAAFTSASQALFGKEQTDKFLDSIQKHIKYHPDKPLQLVFRTKDSFLWGWNVHDSILFYRLDFRTQTSCRLPYIAVFDCSKNSKAVIV